MTKEVIAREACAFVEEYARKPGILTRWGTPVVGVADAYHQVVRALKRTASPTHMMPEDVLSGARVIIAYYIPFTRALAACNRIDGCVAAEEWARAYVETNALLHALGERIVDCMHAEGVRAALPDVVFDREALRSNWSHRHIAYAAGLGTIGMNNMLITRAGCCGRLGTVVAEMSIVPDTPMEGEYCLFKQNGGCLQCVAHCPTHALSPAGFDRQACNRVCLENDARYGSDVCGKCVVFAPCAFGTPNAANECRNLT